MSAVYLIFSNEHGAWWRPSRCGYTVMLKAAGRYTRDEALSICAHARDGMSGTSCPSEIPVREEDALECVSRFVITLRSPTPQEAP